MQLELITKPQGPVLKAYSNCKSRCSFIMGPLGSGKTWESCVKVMGLMASQRANSQGIRKSRWYAVRNTYPDLLGITLKDWMELFSELGKYKGGGMEPPCHRLHFKLSDRTTVQSELIFLALDRPQSIKKLRGAQATGFWLNETKELDKAVVDMADLRHGRYPSKMDGGPSWHGMIGDTNAPDDDHWYYELEQTIKPLGWDFFTQPGGLKRELVNVGKGLTKWTGKWIENPDAENLDNLPKDYYKRGQEGKTEEWIAVNLANEYGTVHTGKPIYKNQWIKAFHVSDKIVPLNEIPLVIGLDFGLTPAAVLGQQTPRGAINILDELVVEGMGINQFITDVVKPHIKNTYPGIQEVIYIGDPAGNIRAQTDEQTVFKELETLGIDALTANSNNPDMRWEAVRWYLQQLRDSRPAFQVHPRCKFIIKGFNGGYQLRRIQIAGSDAKYSFKALKNKFSHPHDALQYLMMYFRGDYEVLSETFDRSSSSNIDLWGS